jgi:hypothetical protein
VWPTCKQPCGLVVLCAMTIKWFGRLRCSIVDSGLPDWVCGDGLLWGEFWLPKPSSYTPMQFPGGGGRVEATNPKPLTWAHLCKELPSLVLTSGGATAAVFLDRAKQGVILCGAVAQCCVPALCSFRAGLTWEACRQSGTYSDG